MTVLSTTLAKHLKKIKASGGNKVLSPGSTSKKETLLNPQSAEEIANSTEHFREERAKCFRNDGNNFYKDGHYIAAHFSYTKSIGAAFKPLTKAMGYANR